MAYAKCFKKYIIHLFLLCFTFFFLACLPGRKFDPHELIVCSETFREGP